MSVFCFSSYQEISPVPIDSRFPPFAQSQETEELKKIILCSKQWWKSNRQQHTILFHVFLSSSSKDLWCEWRRSNAVSITEHFHVFVHRLSTIVPLKIVEKLHRNIYMYDVLPKSSKAYKKTFQQEIFLGFVFLFLLFVTLFNHLRANLTQWSNTFKQL